MGTFLFRVDRSVLEPLTSHFADLTIPIDEIKDIQPAMTMVSGRVVYEAAAPAASTR